MNLYRLHQNNSGGIWDESLPRYMFIEAEDAASANSKAEALGAYFDGCAMGRDCNCCGDRWTRCDESGAVRSITDSTTAIMQYHSTLDGIEAYRIYHADGWIAVESAPESDGVPVAVGVAA